MKDSNNSPLCPICKAQMVKRQAKKGSNAGYDFYGCSNFPHCKGVRNIEDNKDINNNRLAKNKVEYKGNLLSVRKKTLNIVSLPYKNYKDVKYFHSLGISSNMMRQMRNDEIHYDKYYQLSKFRVEYSDSIYKVNNDQKAIANLILRLLCRGDITLNSPLLQDNIYGIYKDNTTDYVRPYFEDTTSNNDIDLFVTDSELEKEFLYSLKKHIFKNTIRRFVNTQVLLSSLIDDESNIFKSTNQRLDFFISYEGVDLIVELDGDEHENHKEKDLSRDNVLRNNGYIVLRIKNSDFINNKEHVMNRIIEIIKYKEKNYSMTYTTFSNKFVHQVQIAVVSALIKGVFGYNSKMFIDYNNEAVSCSEINKLLEISLTDLKLLFDEFCILYGIDSFFECKASEEYDDLIIMESSNRNNISKIMITDIHFNNNIRNEINVIDIHDPINVDEKSLKYFLKYVFQFDDFREGQIEGVTRFLERKDSIILLPTGSGKSLVYQLSSLLVPGKTIVISPLVSLMKDQLDNLCFNGITSVTAIYSDINIKEKEKEFMQSNTTLAYMSPERLQTKNFRDIVKQLSITNKIYCVAIDEAHCVSEWGHDFRTAYLNIGRTSRNIFEKDGQSPVIIALTGTASTAVLKDVKRELEINNKDSVITPETFDRKELHYKVFKSESDSKKENLDIILNQLVPDNFGKSSDIFFNEVGTKSNGGIIFCPHVNGDFGVVNICDSLNTQAKKNIFSGQKPSKLIGDWEKIKDANCKEYKSNKLNLLFATKAFGMGIDKPNVRYTIHYNIPSSIESFYQEAGRAGRDGNEAICIMLVSNDNQKRNDYILDPKTDLDEVSKIISETNRENQDDITRLLFFHLNSFKGAKFESNIIKKITSKLFEDGKLSNKSMIYKCNKSIEEETLSSIQKGIQRLLVLGVIDDYTVNYSADEIYISPGYAVYDKIIDSYCNYVKGYNEARVATERKKITKMVDKYLAEHKSPEEIIVECAKILIEFIYDTVEKGRRRGIKEMLKIVEAASKVKNQDDEIRKRVTRYFESTYSIEIDQILDSKTLGFEVIPRILDGSENEVYEMIGGIRSNNEANGLRAQVSRYLESTPDHPGLLALRSLSEVLCKEYNKEVVISDFQSYLKFAKERYSIDINDLLGFNIYILSKIMKVDVALATTINKLLINEYDFDELMSAILDSSLFSEKEKTIPSILYFENKTKSLLKTIDRIKGEV